MFSWAGRWVGDQPVVIICELNNENNKTRKSILRIGIITNIIFGAQEAQNFDFFEHFFGSAKIGRKIDFS